MVAPIGRNGKQGGIYAWVGELQGRREDDEAKRLLYVAATRARKELHLLGTAVTKVNNELSPGERRSLLGIAWPALQGDFERARGPQSRHQMRRRRKPNLLSRQRSPLSVARLPADWKPPTYSTAAQARREIRRSSNSRAVRWLRAPSALWCTRCWRTWRRWAASTPPGVSQAMFDEVAGWRVRALAILRSSGLPRAEAEPLSAEVVRALQPVLRDPTGRWILGARAGGEERNLLVNLGRCSGANAARRSHFSRWSNARLGRRDAPMDRRLQNRPPWRLRD